MVNHLIIKARAGTGKTFSVIEGLNRMMEKKTKGIKGSEQQVAIWNRMVDGEDFDVRTSPFFSATLIAFNKSIATELQKKVPEGASASTIHSLGFAAVRNAVGQVQVNQHKTSTLIEEFTQEDIRETRLHSPAFVTAVTKLVSLCKLTLTYVINEQDEIFDAQDEETQEAIREANKTALDELTNLYGVELNGKREEVYEAVPTILQWAREQVDEIDYDDMIWLPIVNGYPIRKSDVLLVDEAQDLNRCQQEIALRAGKRLILCGDDMQAIYGFAGADSGSIDRMNDLLSENGDNVEVLPLTVSRRCAKSVIREAQRLVPDIEALDNAPEGTVSTIEHRRVQEMLAPEDMVICRTNAPLVSLAFRLLKERKKVRIQGRSFGKEITNLIKRLRVRDVDSLLTKLDDYEAKERKRIAQRKVPSESAMIALSDKCECIRTFCDGATTLKEVNDTIDSIFDDESKQGEILLSSIHKAKGLEAPRVFILERDSIPHPMAKTLTAVEQEKNLLYVAITRAMRDLIYVKGESK